ncbi:unnamed protein product [Blepharisma stoltei]|uniref:Uncharacterized protein n=1 Tax=Blepharisma stoltei TaxID=1481888 RepID=A0AAU9K293_9CILI|nr:unnamed protein product [Blepharisma stoltei]
MLLLHSYAFSDTLFFCYFPLYSYLINSNFLIFFLKTSSNKTHKILILFDTIVLYSTKNSIYFINIIFFFCYC